MHSIEIDDSDFTLLQQSAKLFVDTPNTVLRRLLRIDTDGATGVPSSQDAVEAATRFDSGEISQFIAELDSELRHKGAPLVTASNRKRISSFWPRLARYGRGKQFI